MTTSVFMGLPPAGKFDLESGMPSGGKAPIERLPALSPFKTHAGKWGFAEALPLYDSGIAAVRFTSESLRP